MKKFGGLLVLLLLITITTANEPLKPTLIKTAPTIDGLLDDAAWQGAATVTGFKTFIPDFGKDLSEKTKVYMAYDRENLYFAFKCYDREPDKIKASMSNRDNIREDDWICINLDSFNDQQSLYAFYVNPLGIQADTRFTGNDEDAGVDMVWYSAGRLDNDGYTIEIRIPLKSIRYSDTNPVQMAVFFERKISRRSEQGSVPALDPAMGYAFLTQLQPMYYYDVEHYTLLEVLPAVTFGQNYINKAGDMKVDNVNRDFSVTMKYGLTSDLILDGTYNPDFSQVEADAGQVDVNLRNSLYFDEKRPFFLEGRENFWMAGTGISEVDPVRSIVHTRNILNPVTGVKLAGKIGRDNTVAILYALDENEDPNPGEEKHTHFPIVRYKRSISGDGFIGGMIAVKEDKNSYNRLWGADGLVRLTGSSRIEFGGIYSTSKNQDETNGNMLGLKYDAGTRDLDFNLSAKHVSEDFAADMGYVTRTGITTFAGLARPKLYPAVDYIRRIDLEVFTSHTRDHFYDKWETFNHVSANAFLFGSLQLKVKYSYSDEIFLAQKFKTGGFHVFGGGWFTNQLYFGLLYRGVKAIYYSAVPFQGKSNKITANLIYKPTDKLMAEVDFTYSDLYRDSDNEKVYDYPIGRAKLTYQVNKYLFFRGIVEYNDFYERLTTDLLASFTYIPGTVIHFGYGSRYEKTEWVNDRYEYSNNFNEMRRGFFFKASYLWRL